MKARIGQAVVLILLFGVLILTINGFSGNRMSIPNLGFEGAKCNFYGMDWRKDQDWTGTYTLHRYQDAEPTLVSHYGSEGSSDKIYWGTAATPNDAALDWEHWNGWTGSVGTKKWPELGVHVESNIQLQDILAQGQPDPLHFNDTNPLDAQRIEYWHWDEKKVSETATQVVYNYTVTKKSFLLVPAEFWVGFYLVPSQSNAETGSGWREGEWQNIVCWFRLDFVTWDQAIQTAWLEDPKVYNDNTFTGTIYENVNNGTVTSRNSFNQYRGGFPIQGWIQGWEKAGYTSSGPADSPLWLQTQGKENSKYTMDQLTQLKDKLMAKVSFAPSMVGSTLSLYDEPSATFSYDLSQPVSPNSVETPASWMKKTMYFPVNIQNFGTYTTGDWWNGYTVYYPTAYFRIRMIYGVYGTFTYLWTEQVTKPISQGGLNYPSEFERRTTSIVYESGVGSYFSFLSNPLFLIIVFAIIGIIILVLIGPWIGFGLFQILGLFKYLSIQGRVGLRACVVGKG